MIYRISYILLEYILYMYNNDTMYENVTNLKRRVEISIIKMF